MTEATVIPTGEVHPVAELFPMLPDDELQELADDIRANGLRHPIALDKDGVLIDGRNRWAACQMAGVDPRFTCINGDDPVAYILSSNVSRRHMMKGQRAMVRVAAKSSKNEDFWGSQIESSEELQVSTGLISEAATVLRFAPDLVGKVISGAEKLSDAYAEAQRRKRAETTDEARFKKLQEQAPDLATLVAEERLTLGEAWETYQRREREELERRKEVTKGYLEGIGKLWSYLATNDDIIVKNWEPSVNSFKHAAPLQHLTTSQGVRMVADRLERLAKEIDKQGGELA